MPGFEDDVTSIALKVFEQREFRHYADYRQKILARLLDSYLTQIEAKTGATRADLSSKKAHADEMRRRKGSRAKGRAFVFGGCAGVVMLCWMVLWLVPTATLARHLNVDPGDSWIGRHITALIVWLVVASVLAAVTCGAQTVRRATALRTLLEPVDEARGVYRRTLESAVQEAVSIAINDELGPRGIVAFPTHAPRLVELDSSQITPSRMTRYVRDFILEHEASAIGLAGTRGSGKSTVMRALHADRDLGLVRIVPSPVRYDPGEFLRLLLGEIASAIAGYPPNGSVVRMRVQMPVPPLSTLSVMAALGTLLAVFSPFRAGWLKEFAFPDPVTILGILILLVTGFLALLRALNTVFGRGQPSDVRVARELLRDLKWETERGLTAKGTLKFQPLFESGGESSLKLKRRAHTRSDVVGALRHLLALFADQRMTRRLVVCIDELDKIDTAEHLVEIVNELKDLFHVQGVHFVVAVSTDALESFEKRGLSSRDAFDSALDTIVHTDRLTLEESLAVVISRATGFAPLIAMFCHAWSGGLARDLLRAARTLVEQQRQSQQGPLSLVQLIEHLVCTELHAALRASMHALGTGDDQIETLWQLSRSLEHARKNPDTATEAMPNLVFRTPTLRALHAKTWLGMSLLHLAHTAQMLPTYWDYDNPAVRELATRLSQHAVAISEIDAPPPIRDAALNAALHTINASTIPSSEHKANS
ncbi:P-loop NTPase fold protein [Nocardia wallacei]|uniref:P-loop NTPase fold protein n=1 Tax=Nocardia wallacei TaxID=480035 RepID=UPI002456D75C|nr:P-loop NTPase fold protein [Nocardia wallacei]